LALSPGARLGVYEIIASIGVGGMGQVFRATDTKLKRQVAIKILPPLLGGDPDRLARFQREAEVLASLNHPNIAGIYGLEESPSTGSGQAGVVALVMELVEGEDLSTRIARGAIPIDEALPIAKQIADALEAAHEQGIIHRDLKPANIKVRDDGTVKVLDFGLAKAMDLRPSGTSGLSMSPTITTPAMTQAGVILGTAAYMSPEQARGRSVDKRADIWAFGAVLFEMLTGRRAFPGEDITDTIVSVVSKEPEWTALPATTPAGVRRLLARCLKKDPKARMRDIGEARLQLDEVIGGAPEEVSTAAAQRPAPRPVWKRALPFATAAIVAGAMVGVVAWIFRSPVPSAPVMRFAISLGEGHRFTLNNNQSLSISPDGTRLVYVADAQLYLRSLSDLEARPLAGTQQFTPNTPAFSPDNQSVAFFAAADRTIKKMAVSGGAAVTICPADGPFLGMSWDTGGLVFGQGGKGILGVSANGGQPALVASVKSGEIAASPQMLPGGEWVLFTIAATPTVEGWDKAQVVIQSLKTSERKTLVAGGAEGRYVPTGHITYANGGVLFAVPFDVRRLAVTGGPVPVVEGIKRSPAGAFGTAHLSVSNNGSLVFTPGPISTSGGQYDLALIDRTGSVQPLKLPPAQYQYPRLSPDGKRIAVGSDDGKDAIVWIYDVSGATSIRRLTLGGRNRVPVWSADGERVAFQSDREGDLAIWWQRSDGATPAERLTKPDKDTVHVPQSWSPDGKTLLLSVAKGGSYSVAALSLGNKTVTPFGGIQSAIPPGAAFSPDGKWVAYAIREATRPGINVQPLFVQPFPATGARYQVARNGIHPTWAPDGKELFYGSAPVQFTAVSVATQPAFSFGNPTQMPYRSNDQGPLFERNNDIMPDGKQFLGVVAAGLSPTSGSVVAPEIRVVLNWFTELQQRVPTR
jgi:serine/threonine-protein kinase